MYKYFNNFLPPAIYDLYVSNNYVHKYSTRQNIYFILTRVTLMYTQKALESRMYVNDLGRQPGRYLVCSLQFLTMNPLQYKLDFWMFIRGISHGFNGTQDKLVMARNLKDIL